MKQVKRILVTGGAGFIGSHLIDRLLLTDDEVEVWCMDNLSTGSLDNIRHHLDDPRFHLVRQDVRLPLKSIPPDVRFDEVYHLACPASPLAYQSDPKGTLKTCFLGTLNVLSFALSQQGAHHPKVFLASTSEVYGDPEVHPQPESYAGRVRTVGPRACYDEGKRAAETLCWTYREDLPIRIARIFNTYGPRMASGDGRVIPNFLKAALNQAPLVVYGDGQQTRSFQFVDDLVEGIVRLMAQPQRCWILVNLGRPEECTIEELARLVIKQTGSQSPIQYTQSAPIDDPKRRLPDIGLARELLGWEPRVSLAEGIKRMLSKPS